MVPKNKNKISLIVQEGTLKSKYPNSRIIRDKENKIQWEGILKPTPLSGNYKIQIIYQSGKGIDVFVKEPFPLQLAENKKSLPHVYSTKEQKLCLYYPKGNEWNKGQLYTETIIPWISEWLFHYEIWLATEIWFGGGIHNETEKKDDNKE
jgi:hypothetical protein